MVTQEEFKRYTANLLNFFIIGNHDHARLNRGATGWMKLLLFFNLNQAYTASPLRGEPGTMAQRGDINPRTLGCFQDGHPFLCFYFYTVYD
jgi:hypothetical protein